MKKVVVSFYELVKDVCVSITTLIDIASIWNEETSISEFQITILYS